VERVRARAYELYEVRGRINGHAEEDWLQPEDDLAGSSEPKQPQDRCDNIGPIGLLFLYVRPYVEEIVGEADDDSTIT